MVCPDKLKMKNLRFGTVHDMAQQSCCSTGTGEKAGYAFRTGSTWLADTGKPNSLYFDSIMRRPVITAPVDRTQEQFVAESKEYGWPLFTDKEINWEVVRVIDDSHNLVTIDGVHLGYMKPGKNGNRYAVNLASISGDQKMWTEEMV